MLFGIWSSNFAASVFFFLFLYRTNKKVTFITLTYFAHASWTCKNCLYLLPLSRDFQNVMFYECLLHRGMQWMNMVRFAYVIVCELCLSVGFFFVKGSVLFTCEQTCSFGKRHFVKVQSCSTCSKVQSFYLPLIPLQGNWKARPNAKPQAGVGHSSRAGAEGSLMTNAPSTISRNSWFLGEITCKLQAESKRKW